MDSTDLSVLRGDLMTLLSTWKDPFFSVYSNLDILFLNLLLIVAFAEHGFRRHVLTFHLMFVAQAVMKTPQIPF